MQAVIYRWQQAIPPKMALMRNIVVFLNFAYTLLVLNYSCVGFMVSPSLSLSLHVRSSISSTFHKMKIQTDTFVCKDTKFFRSWNRHSLSFSFCTEFGLFGVGIDILLFLSFLLLRHAGVEFTRDYCLVRKCILCWNHYSHSFDPPWVCNQTGETSQI